MCGSRVCKVAGRPDGDWSPCLVTDLGKAVRLGRVTGPQSGRSVIVPIDHPVEDPSLTDLNDPVSVVAALAPVGPDAFLMRRRRKVATCCRVGRRRVRGRSLRQLVDVIFICRSRKVVKSRGMNR
jgi:hypothetical protein